MYRWANQELLLQWSTSGQLYSCTRGTNCILPSVEVSQKQELAVCRPAPFFCMMIQVTVGDTEGKMKISQHRKQRRTVGVSVFTNVLERLSQLAELTEALLHHAVGPLVHSVLLIGIWSDRCIHTLDKRFDGQLVLAPRHKRSTGTVFVDGSMDG